MSSVPYLPQDILEIIVYYVSQLPEDVSYIDYLSNYSVIYRDWVYYGYNSTLFNLRLVCKALKMMVDAEMYKTVSTCSYNSDAWPSSVEGTYFPNRVTRIRELSKEMMRYVVCLDCHTMPNETKYNPANWIGQLNPHDFPKLKTIRIHVRSDVSENVLRNVREFSIAKKELEVCVFYQGPFEMQLEAIAVSPTMFQVMGICDRIRNLSVRQKYENMRSNRFTYLKQMPNLKKLSVHVEHPSFLYGDLQDGVSFTGFKDLTISSLKLTGYVISHQQICIPSTIIELDLDNEMYIFKLRSADALFGHVKKLHLVSQIMTFNELHQLRQQGEPVEFTNLRTLHMDMKYNHAAQQMCRLTILKDILNGSPQLTDLYLNGAKPVDVLMVCSRINKGMLAFRLKPPEFGDASDQELKIWDEILAMMPVLEKAEFPIANLAIPQLADRLSSNKSINDGNGFWPNSLREYRNNAMTLSYSRDKPAKINAIEKTFKSQELLQKFQSGNYEYKKFYSMEIDEREFSGNSIRRIDVFDIEEFRNQMQKSGN